MIWLAIAAALAAASAEDALAPARRGLVQCYVPDEVAKTCQSIGSYEFRSDGTILNTATTAISAKPLLVMTSVSPVVVKDGAICGHISRDDVEGASMTLEGAPLESSRAQQLKAALISSMTSVIGREVCTRSDPHGVIQGRVTVDGVRQPDMELPVQWVSPNAYRVGR